MVDSLEWPQERKIDNRTKTVGVSRESQRHLFLESVLVCEERLLRSARRLHRNDEDAAQELVQEGIVQAYEAFLRGQYNERQQMLSWLLRIQTNLFVSEYRRGRKWEAGVTVESLTMGGETGPETTRAPSRERPDARLMERTLDEAIERALNNLPENLRLPVLLVDVEDFTYQEAADILRVPKGTLRSRLHRARQTLYEMLRSYAQDCGWMK